MDYDIVIFWIVCFSCLSGLAVMWTHVRFTAPGWAMLYLGILLLSVAGWLLEQPGMIYAAAATWLLLVLLPRLITRLYHRRFMQQQYSAARRLAQIVSWLHPADGWREQPKIIHALELAQQGELTAAAETLKRFQEVRSLIGMAAVVNLYRITNQWEELLVWHARHREEIERHPQLLFVVLRARGETGDVHGLVEFYDRHRQQIGKLIPATSRDVCRLMLFAFCGKRQAAESLCAGSLAVLPAPTRAFWLATADLAAGASESAKRQLEDLLPAADPLMRGAIERRLSRISIRPDPLDASAERVIEEGARQHGHEERFGARRSLFSNGARATQILIMLNVCMFVAELHTGGGTDLGVLYHLGALYPPAVLAGEWWRLIASLFLHFGPIHLAMNMFALWILGPFAEFALGFRRFILVYLLAGIGSMGMVMLFGSGPNGEQLTVGASGCVMGLVGATGALMLRGWL
ncbi:MAG: rhomboid family intramembrane serine protease, partial [Thermoguttaceae bacterium]